METIKLNSKQSSKNAYPRFVASKVEEMRNFIQSLPIGQPHTFYLTSYQRQEITRIAPYSQDWATFKRIDQCKPIFEITRISDDLPPLRAKPVRKVKKESPYFNPDEFFAMYPDKPLSKRSTPLTTVKLPTPR